MAPARIGIYFAELYRRVGIWPGYVRRVGAVRNCCARRVGHTVPGPVIPGITILVCAVGLPGLPSVYNRSHGSISQYHITSLMRRLRTRTDTMPSVAPSR
ncbi:hypothetical protein NPIL_11841 [Nephila pilipes]|uniref:Uncharacterized protein n=1 Tax=Nephila pilipes TaxID=299642 RepID=A0A8X6NLF4_NEPPI|nr:hypothetical protein NPIL_11841 [Nephila pilipes]